MHILLRYLPHAVCLLSVACASHTGVVKTGTDTYMLAKQAATGFSGLGNLKGELLQEAALHCKGQKKEMRLLGAVESQPPYILGNYPRAEITFACT